MDDDLRLANQFLLKYGFRLERRYALIREDRPDQEVVLEEKYALNPYVELPVKMDFLNSVLDEA